MHCKQVCTVRDHVKLCSTYFIHTEIVRLVMNSTVILKQKGKKYAFNNLVIVLTVRKFAVIHYANFKGKCVGFLYLIMNCPVSLSLSRSLSLFLSLSDR